MKNEQIICNYCKRPVPEKTDEMPTWFGKYDCDVRTDVICKDCFPKNKEQWRKGGKSKS